jgi:hypothetical protein
VKYLTLTAPQREELWARLSEMPAFLAERFSALTPEEAARPGPGGTFSPVEHCWHLADLEREGFAERIRRLRLEEEPRLPDFDGARVARERDYRRRSLGEGMALFREARDANLAALRALDAATWSRAGFQEGVGRIMLCDLPTMMAEHDASHRAEILAA